MQAVRYRSGIDGETGEVITGRVHLAQSLVEIWTTSLGRRVMLLGFGADLRSHLAEDITGALALEIYDDLTSAIYEWEPEYRVAEMQLVKLTRIGGLGLRHSGIYFPEGRLGNYAIQENFGGVSSLARYEGLALGRAA